MPVEIRELIIRVITTAEDNNPNLPSSVRQADPEEVVQECVKQVLYILKKEKER